jgi:hypothetical protein
VECPQTAREQLRRFSAKKPDHRHRRLLRACGERPGHRGPAKKHDEIPPFQLIEVHPVPIGQVAARRAFA